MTDPVNPKPVGLAVPPPWQRRALARIEADFEREERVTMTMTIGDLMRSIENGDYEGVAEGAVDLLGAEVKRLRSAIAEHRDQRDDDRYHLDDLKLYAALGDGQPAETALPPRCDFLASCERFWEQRQRPGEKVAGPEAMTIRQLEGEAIRFRAERDALMNLIVLPGDGPMEGRWSVPAGGTASHPNLPWCFRDRAEAVAAVRRAAGLDGEAR